MYDDEESAITAKTKQITDTTPTDMDEQVPTDTEQTATNEQPETDGQTTETLQTAEAERLVAEPPKTAEQLMDIIQETANTVVAEVADEDKDEYIEVPYSRLSKLEKYKVSYAMWEDCTPKTPEIKRLLMYLSHLIFFTQLAKHKKGDKEIKADLKRVEGCLRDVYEDIFGSMFQ